MLGSIAGLDSRLAVVLFAGANRGGADLAEDDPMTVQFPTQAYWCRLAPVRTAPKLPRCYRQNFGNLTALPAPLGFIRTEGSRCARISAADFPSTFATAFHSCFLGYHKTSSRRLRSAAHYFDVQKQFFPRTDPADRAREILWEKSGRRPCSRSPATCSSLISRSRITRIVFRHTPANATFPEAQHALLIRDHHK